MRRFKLSPQAADDIRQIWAYIASNNIKAARRVRLAFSMSAGKSPTTLESDTVVRT